MCQVTRSNFEALLPDIEQKIDMASFFAVDLEFTGLTVDDDSRPNLFDGGKQRYDKLRRSVSSFTICQIGVSLFSPSPISNKFDVFAYNFHLFPAPFGPVDTRFMCQASSLQFLCKHNFDFNCFIYDGIPYMNGSQESILKEHLENQDHLTGSERDADESYLQECCSQVADWLLQAAEGQHLNIPIECDPTTAYCLIIEIRARFDNVWAVQEDKHVIVETVTKERKGQLLKEHKVKEEEDILRTNLGFTQVFRRLGKAKLPMLGHNNLTDVMLMYDKFYNPLPASYVQFKSDVHRLFPVIYDTKQIAMCSKKILERTGLLDNTGLGSLYQAVTSKEGHFLVLLQPDIKFAPGYDCYTDAYVPHEAGFDAYMCGVVFIRLLHILRNRGVPSTCVREMSAGEYLSAAKPYLNTVNMIRGALNYVRFGADDPQSSRPPMLHVSSRNTLCATDLARLFAPYGTVDFQITDKRCALLATGNFRAYRDILAAFKGHRAMRVVRYSVFMHSRTARRLFHVGLMLTGSACLITIVTIFKTRS